jgi:hypothetical protein
MCLLFFMFVNYFYVYIKKKSKYFLGNTSNSPRYLVEHNLFSTLFLEDETEFLEKSKELGVLKKCCITILRYI